jgi:hypothetical protein
MLVGAFNRESALFLAPLAYAVWADRPLDRAALARVAAVAAPVMYAAAAWTLDRRPRLFAPTLVACAALIFGYAGYMQLEGVDNIIEQSPPPYPVR